MEKRELKFLAILAVAIIILCLVGFLYVSHLEQIKQKAIGTELIPSSLEGGYIEIVEAEDVTAITFVKCPGSDKGCYRVSIQKESSMWYIYYDSTTFEPVEIEQLFVT